MGRYCSVLWGVFVLGALVGFVGAGELLDGEAVDRATLVQLPLQEEEQFLHEVAKRILDVKKQGFSRTSFIIQPSVKDSGGEVDRASHSKAYLADSPANKVEAEEEKTSGSKEVVAPPPPALEDLQPQPKDAPIVKSLVSQLKDILGSASKSPEEGDFQPTTEVVVSTDVPVQSSESQESVEEQRSTTAASSAVKDEVTSFLQSVASSSGFKSALVGNLIKSFSSMNHDSVRLLYNLLMEPLKPSESAEDNSLSVSDSIVSVFDKQQSPLIANDSAQSFGDDWSPYRSSGQKSRDDSVNVITAPPTNKFEMVVGSSLNPTSGEVTGRFQRRSGLPLLENLRLGMHMPPPEALDALPPGAQIILPSQLKKQPVLPRITINENNIPVPVAGPEVRVRRPEGSAPSPVTSALSSLPNFLASLFTGSREESSKERPDRVRTRRPSLGSTFPDRRSSPTEGSPIAERPLFTNPHSQRKPVHPYLRNSKQPMRQRLPEVRHRQDNPRPHRNPQSRRPDVRNRHREMRNHQPPPRSQRPSIRQSNGRRIPHRDPTRSPMHPQRTSLPNLMSFPHTRSPPPHTLNIQESSPISEFHGFPTSVPHHQQVQESDFNYSYENFEELEEEPAFRPLPQQSLVRNSQRRDFQQTSAPRIREREVQGHHPSFGPEEDQQDLNSFQPSSAFHHKEDSFMLDDDAPIAYFNSPGILSSLVPGGAKPKTDLLPTSTHFAVRHEPPTSVNAPEDSHYYYDQDNVSEYDFKRIDSEATPAPQPGIRPQPVSERLPQEDHMSVTLRNVIQRNFTQIHQHGAPPLRGIQSNSKKGATRPQQDRPGGATSFVSERRDIVVNKNYVDSSAVRNRTQETDFTTPSSGEAYGAYDYPDDYMNAFEEFSNSYPEYSSDFEGSAHFGDRQESAGHQQDGKQGEDHRKEAPLRRNDNVPQPIRVPGADRHGSDYEYERTYDSRVEIDGGRDAYDYAPSDRDYFGNPLTDVQTGHPNGRTDSSVSPGDHTSSTEDYSYFYRDYGSYDSSSEPSHVFSPSHKEAGGRFDYDENREDMFHNRVVSEMAPVSPKSVVFHNQSSVFNHNHAKSNEEDFPPSEMPQFGPIKPVDALNDINLGQMFSDDRVEGSEPVALDVGKPFESSKLDLFDESKAFGPFNTPRNVEVHRGRPTHEEPFNRIDEVEMESDYHSRDYDSEAAVNTRVPSRVPPHFYNTIDEVPQSADSFNTRQVVNENMHSVVRDTVETGDSTRYSVAGVNEVVEEAPPAEEYMAYVLIGSCVGLALLSITGVLLIIKFKKSCGSRSMRSRSRLNKGSFPDVSQLPETFLEADNGGHKLGSWFTGKSGTFGSGKLRSNMTLPEVISSSRRDLLSDNSSTSGSDSQRSKSSNRENTSRDSDSKSRNSWLHNEYNGSDSDGAGLSRSKSKGRSSHRQRSEKKQYNSDVTDLTKSEGDFVTTDSEFYEAEQPKPKLFGESSKEMENIKKSRSSQSVTTSQELGENLSRDIRHFQAKKLTTLDPKQAEEESVRRSTSEASFSRDTVQNEVFLEFDNIFKQHGHYLSDGQQSSLERSPSKKKRRSPSPDSMDLKKASSVASPPPPPRFTPPPPPPRPPKPEGLVSKLSLEFGGRK